MENAMKNAMMNAMMWGAALGLLVLGCHSAAPGGDEPIAVSDELRALAHYEFPSSRAAVASYEALVREAGDSDTSFLEDEMLWILRAEDATFAGKQFACRMLRRIGTERALPVLGEMLHDPELAHPARFALQGLDTPRADATLRAAAKELDGDLRIGVIDSLAARGDRRAVPLLAELIDGGDEATVRACLSALGRIGGAEAARVVAETDVGSALPVEKYDAQLRCADSMLDDGDAQEALAMFRGLTGPDYPEACRIAAWRGIVRAAPDHALDAIGELLRDGEPALQNAAASFLVELPLDVDTAPLARKLWTFDAAARVPALGALAVRGEESAMRAATEALADEDVEVRVAGLHALGVVGDERVLGSLVSFATRTPAEVEAAVAAIERLRGEGVDEAFLHMLREASEDTRAALIPCLTARRSPGAVNALLGFCARGNRVVQGASLHGMEALAGEGDLPRMLLLLGTLETTEERALLGDALLAVCRRADDEERAAGVLVRSLREWPAAPRAELLRVLGELPSATTLGPLVWSVENGDGEVRTTALRALANWPDPAPRDVLRAAITNAASDEERAIALRGYLHVVWLDDAMSSAEVHRAHDAAYTATQSDQEKVLVIESVARARDPWAIRFLTPLACYGEGEERDERGMEDVAVDERRVIDAFKTVSSRLSRLVPGDSLGGDVTLTHSPVEPYQADGPGTLTDGEWGGTGHGDGRWLGFLGVDLEAVVDLGENVEVRELRLGYLDSQNSWIFAPRSVEFALSSDGKTWVTPEPRKWRFRPHPRAAGGRSGELPPPRVGTHGFWLEEPTMARYVRVRAKNIGKLPDWHPGSGEDGWLFVDEIQVNPQYGD